jgi:hypothetical protein
VAQAPIAIGIPVTFRAPQAQLVLRALRGALVALLVVGCCSFAVAVAAPNRSGAVDPAATNTFGSSVPSNAFSPRVAPVERVPEASTNLKLRSVPCASAQAAGGTRCFALG